MDNLIIEGTKSFPQIMFIPEINKFEISGHSYPQDPITEYEPVFNWVETNLGKLKDRKVSFSLKLYYFNSSSNRIILTLLKKIEEFYNSGSDIEINWYYDDEEIFNDGKIFAALINVPMNFIPLPKDYDFNS